MKQKYPNFCLLIVSRCSQILFYLSTWNDGKCFKKIEGEASNFFCHSSEASRQIPQILESTIDRVCLQLARGRLYEEAEPRHRREQKPFSRQRSKEMLTTSGTTFPI